MNIPRLIFASFIAGYAMLGVDILFDGFLGLFGTYRDYIAWIKDFGIFAGYEDIAMVVGHQVNSLALGVFFAHPYVYRRLPRNPFIRGLTFGAGWHVWVMFIAYVSFFLGAQPMGKIVNSELSEHISLLLMHLIWALVLSILYDEEG
jgi:hypothetical protein